MMSTQSIMWLLGQAVMRPQVSIQHMQLWGYLTRTAQQAALGWQVGRHTANPAEPAACCRARLPSGGCPKMLLW